MRITVRLDIFTKSEYRRRNHDLKTVHHSSVQNCADPNDAGSTCWLRRKMSKVTVSLFSGTADTSGAYVSTGSAQRMLVQL